MTALIEGLELYAIVLMILGIVLFLVALIFLFRKAADWKLKITLFLVAIICIGFTAVEKIDFWGATVDLKDQLGKPPEERDEAVIENNIRKLQDVPLSMENKTMLAEAYYAVGDRQQALDVATEVLSEDQDNEKAKMIKADIEVKRAIDRIRRDADDMEAKRQLRANLAHLESRRERGPDYYFTLLQASRALNDTAAARRNWESLKRVDPDYRSSFSMQLDR